MRRKTPYLDEWREELLAELDEWGDRSDLARFLMKEQGVARQTALNRVSLILSGKSVPNGETVLAVNAWRASRSS